MKRVLCSLVALLPICAVAQRCYMIPCRTGANAVTPAASWSGPTHPVGRGGDRQASPRSPPMLDVAWSILHGSQGYVPDGRVDLKPRNNNYFRINNLMGMNCGS